LQTSIVFGSAARIAQRPAAIIACLLLTVLAVGIGTPGNEAAGAAMHRNRLANASFERSLAPWGGTRLERRKLPHAPAGRYVARVATSRGRLALDDWPGEITSVANASYRGHMWLRAASPSTVGKRVSVVVREHTKAGDWIASHERTVRLTKRFVRVQTQLRVVRSGDVVDLYAYVHHPRPGNAFFADRAWLARHAGVSGARRTPPPPVAEPPSAPDSSSTVGALSIDTGQAEHLGDTRGYGYVVLQDYMYAHVAEIKRANPETKVLAYLETATQARDCTGQPPAYLPHDSFGVNYCYAAAYHPEWFLTDAYHRRVTYADYSRYAAMDVGNREYQARWASDAIAAARADGFDGIYIDDVNVYPGHGIDGRIGKYTDQQYGSAMVSFIASVADDLRATGLLAVANVAANPWVSWQRTDALAIAAHLTAVNREHYVRYGDICGPFSERFNTTATEGTPPIDELLAYDQAIQAAGASLLGTDYGFTPRTAADMATMSYGRAAFLLAWDGRPGSAYIFRPCGPVPPADPHWMIDVGTPTGPVTVVNGVYERPYSAGLVLLNPSPSTPARVPIPPGYVTPAGARAAEITVPAEGAAILPAG
jgi:hypothetical protein